MAVNTSPVFVSGPQITWSGNMTAANTDTSMATGTSYLVFTAGANGGKVETVNMWNLGTNVSSVIRFFVNNALTTGTAANNALVQEFSWPANTVSQLAASIPTIWQANLYLSAGYRLYATLGTAVAAGIQIAAQGGSY